MLIVFGVIVIVLIVIGVVRRSVFDSVKAVNTCKAIDYAYLNSQSDTVQSPVARYHGTIITDEARVREIMSAEDYAAATVNGTQQLEAIPKLTVSDDVAIVQYPDHQQVIRADQNTLVVVESKYGAPNARQVVLDLPAVLEILWRFKIIERIE